MIVDNGKYYLYRHIRLDTNEPFYIGIGTKKIDSDYYRAKCKDRNSIWNNIVKKTDYQVEILLESNNYNFIIQKEIEFIKLYGRKSLKTGPLCNLTEGGEGVLDISGETGKKISIKLKGVPKTKEHKEKFLPFLELRSGRIWTKEAKDKVGKANLGVNNGMFGKIGKDHKNSKIILQFDKENNFIKEWDNARHITRELGFDFRQISDCCNNKQKTAKGFIWKFK